MGPTEQRATGRLATVRLINGSSGGAMTDRAASAAKLISARGYGRDIVAALVHLREHGAY